MVFATDCRCLLIRLAAPAFEIFLFVGHAPDATYEEAARLAGSYGAASGDDVPLVMMVDASGRVGSEQPSAVGSENSAGEDVGGVKLHACVGTLPLCALATLFDDAAPGTWRALYGKRHKIDWIEFPQCKEPM